jgi:hypothetical protein
MILWLASQQGARRTLVFYGNLARAVRNGSNQAVVYGRGFLAKQ